MCLCLCWLEHQSVTRMPSSCTAAVPAAHVPGHAGPGPMTLDGEPSYPSVASTSDVGRQPSSRRHGTSSQVQGAPQPHDEVDLTMDDDEEARPPPPARLPKKKRIKQEAGADAGAGAAAKRRLGAEAALLSPSASGGAGAGAGGRDAAPPAKKARKGQAGQRGQGRGPQPPAGADGDAPLPGSSQVRAPTQMQALCQPYHALQGSVQRLVLACDYALYPSAHIHTARHHHHTHARGRAHTLPRNRMKQAYTQNII